jgi:hypothetical protein
MDNQYRIKLEIKLKDFTMDNSKYYELIIKVLKKDNRFDVRLNPLGGYSNRIFISSDKFTICTNSIDFKGLIAPSHITIPNKKYLNRNITCTFTTDIQRKIYLKRLHHALMEWSNQWSDFREESQVKFKSLNNKWYFYITK